MSLFHVVPQFKMTADIKKPKRTHKLLQVDSETNNLDLDGESIRMYQFESIYRNQRVSGGYLSSNYKCIKQNCSLLISETYTKTKEWKPELRKSRRHQRAKLIACCCIYVQTKWVMFDVDYSASVCCITSKVQRQKGILHLFGLLLLLTVCL